MTPPSRSISTAMTDRPARSRTGSQVFEDATGRDLSQFKRWYSQAGTPKLTARWRIDGNDFALTLSQEVPATPGQPLKEPAVIPVLWRSTTPTGRNSCQKHFTSSTGRRRRFAGR
jgi:aminopeptidase N